jgi:hypothetical protein
MQHLFTTPIDLYKWSYDQGTIDRIRAFIQSKVVEGKTRYLDYTEVPGEDAALFRKWILECSRQYALDLGRTGGYVVLEKVWGRFISNPYYSVPMHHHSEAWCIGTFYFNDGGGDIMIADTRGYTGEFETGRVKDIEGQTHSICTDFYYTPEKDTAIIFPGFAKHMVHASTTDTRLRMALSWNIKHAETDQFIELFQVDSARYLKV